MQLKFIFPVLLCLLHFGCTTSYKEVPLSVVGYGLSNNALLDIRPRSPLVCSKESCGLLLVIDTPYNLRNGAIFIAGNELQIAAKVVSDTGAQALTPQGLWGKDIFLALRSADTNSRITSVQLSSNVPVQISMIRWVAYDPREVKR